MMWRTAKLDIKSKIVLVLVAVILPTYLIVTVIQNKLTHPLLEQDLRQLGISTGEALAAQIVSNRLLQAVNPSQEIERDILNRLYYQPSVIRMDVFVGDASGVLKLIASSVEDDPNVAPPSVTWTDQAVSEYVSSEEGVPNWKIIIPIKQATKSKKTPAKILGVVHLLVSTRSVDRVLGTFWKVTGLAAAVNVVLLIFILNYFLKKTIVNEKLLRQAENQNLQLSEQLHEAQRHMMNVEKLAVMGELTANFAHEIGTPLNAIGGHLQLLKEEITDSSTPHPRRVDRFDIISGELLRIEQIVKGFLQTTSKPMSQKQLSDLNSLVDKTIGIMRPRLDRNGVDYRASLDRTMGPIRVVPTDIEQILLNLTNNALDSLQSKKGQGGDRLSLEITSHTRREGAEEWAEICISDTGTGIKKADLKNVMKPFFTTKRPGEGTGLGLTICHQLASKYGGVLEISSKEGAWTKVKLKIPYQANV